jgi:hypothetical protein
VSVFEARQKDVEGHDTDTNGVVPELSLQGFLHAVPR